MVYWIKSSSQTCEDDDIDVDDEFDTVGGNAFDIVAGVVVDEEDEDEEETDSASSSWAR